MVEEWSKNIFCLLNTIVIHSGCEKYESFKKKITNTVNCGSFKMYTRYLVNEKNIVPLYMYYRVLSPFCVNTGCNRRNGPDFGRVFLMLNYTEKPQNTYIQS